MANIKVNDLDGLNPTGADLFDDPESFMVELVEEDDEAMAQIIGGAGCGCSCGCHSRAVDAFNNI